MPFAVAHFEKEDSKRRMIEQAAASQREKATPLPGMAAH